MERARWPDERLDDQMSYIERNFDRVFEELRAERAQALEERRAERAAFRAEIGGVRAEIGGVRAEISALRRDVTLIVGGLATGLLGAIAAFVAAQF